MAMQVQVPNLALSTSAKQFICEMSGNLTCTAYGTLSNDSHLNSMSHSDHLEYVKNIFNSQYF